MHASPRVAEHHLVFAVQTMCRMLLVHPSGFYAWLREPLCTLALEDQRQTVLLKQGWYDSGAVYGYSLSGRRLRSNQPRGASCTMSCAPLMVVLRKLLSGNGPWRRH
jgi:hypothetical protein